MEKNKLILRGAAFIGIGAFFSKLLGAIYRVPLTNLIGAGGLGLYQMVFPVYALLLDFSGAGVPSALSKIIACESNGDRATAKRYLNASLKIFIPLGAFFCILTAFFSKSISVFQGDERAYYAYVFLSPSILLVSIISCFRGYFQGLMNMSPTAFSQITEQAVKLVFGLLFAYALKGYTPFAVAGATFAITLSEAVALLQLYLTYKRDVKRYKTLVAFNSSTFLTDAKKIIKTAVPVTLIGIIIPFSQVIDSFLIINQLSAYRSDATVLYGLTSGVVMTVVNLPVSVCYGFATVAIPAVSGGRSETEKARNGRNTLLITLAFALPCALVTFAFANNVIGILFSNLASFEKVTAVNLLRLASPLIILLSFLQTANAVLIGKGKLYAPVMSLTVGVLVKTVLNLTLLKIPRINIYGSVIAVIACYFTVCLINLIMIFKTRVPNESKRACRRGYAS